MKNIAPAIKRQRLLIEGYYSIDVNEAKISDYYKFVCQELSLKAYGEAIIYSPGGEGKEENQGYDAFQPLIDSGISVYIWTKSKFFSLIIYTCKSFDEQKAVEKTVNFFKSQKFTHMNF